MSVENLSKKELMEQLHITHQDLFAIPIGVMEKLFCAAIINQGINTAAKIFRDYEKLKDIIYEK